MILAIDSSDGTSVAVVGDQGLVHSHTHEPDRLRHAEVIGVLIERALQDAGVVASRLSMVAVGVGPGAFTGLRIGMAAAKAFGFAANIAVVGVTSHDAIAYEYYGEQPPSAAPYGEVWVATDAKRRERFVSHYAGVDAEGLPVLVSGPAITADAGEESLLRGQFTAVTGPATALSVGLVAATRARYGRPQLAAEPLYVRSPDISKPKPKRVS